MARKVKVNITMDSELLQRGQEEAEARGVSFSGYISFILSERLEQKKAVFLLDELMTEYKKQQQTDAEGQE